jgi:hypothetical protein
MVYAPKVNSGNEQNGIFVLNDTSGTRYWYSMARADNAGTGEKYTAMLNKVKTKYTGLLAFKEGGLADFTGPAWLDGTKSRPEYILNADQTQKFFQLVDVLDGLDVQSNKNASGDNYFDIQISVEKIDNDYDVERMADKIKQLIYEDSMYRNVNTINQIR